MADDIDHASEREQDARDRAIAGARRMARLPKTYHTHCAWCGDPTEGGDRYCSYGLNSCAGDANHRQAVRQKQGFAE